MSEFSRRKFLKTAAATSAVAVSGCATTGGGSGSSRVVVIGGGYGGTIAAKYIKKFDPGVDVTLIEVNKDYVSCPGSNWVIGGLRPISDLTHSYGNLASKYGIRIVHDWVNNIDAAGQKVMTKGGETIAYDRLVVSPGVDFRYDQIDGYDEAATGKVTHAWKAGPQTTLLRRQLEAMPNGGTFVICPPPNPFRCPPGPAERISMVANYFKTHKPKSKIIALDPKGKFSKQGLFVQGWKQHYGFGTDDSLIEYRHNTTVEEVDVGSNTAITGVDEVKADVLNVIPAQKAGWIAAHAGLTDDSGWCPVDHLTWESKLQKNIHVIGDSAIQSPLPKSGYAANSEAKVCAAAVVALLSGQQPGTPSWANTCYSLVAPNHGISVAMIYDLKDGKVAKVEGSGGLSPMKGGNRALEAVYTESWYQNIINDMFG